MLGPQMVGQLEQEGMTFDGSFFINSLHIRFRCNTIFWNRTFLCGILIGALVGGTVLGVVAALYAQDQSRQSMNVICECLQVLPFVSVYMLDISEIHENIFLNCFQS